MASQWGHDPWPMCILTYDYQLFYITFIALLVFTFISVFMGRKWSFYSHKNQKSSQILHTVPSSEQSTAATTPHLQWPVFTMRLRLGMWKWDPVRSKRSRRRGTGRLKRRRQSVSELEGWVTASRKHNPSSGPVGGSLVISASSGATQLRFNAEKTRPGRWNTFVLGVLVPWLQVTDESVWDATQGVKVSPLLTEVDATKTWGALKMLVQSSFINQLR